MPVIKVKSEEVKIKVPITTLRIEPTTQSKTVEPTIEEQTITPDEGIFALSSVTVNPVTSEIDENIKAENIKEGVSILGVEGTVTSNDYNTKINNITKTTTSYVYTYIEEISNIDLGKPTSTSNLFYGLSNLKKAIFKIDCSQLTSVSNMYGNCSYLEEVQPIDTSKVTNFSGYLSYVANKLYDLDVIDCSSAKNINNMFYQVRTIVNFGGCENLGKNYDPSQSANYSNYTLNLRLNTTFTEQSIINILNGLYDIASLGVKTQQCILGSTNLAKLTSVEGQQALANATAKGWTVS